MNMQYKLYTTQFSHHPKLIRRQFVSSNCGNCNMWIFQILQKSRKRPNSQKSLNTQTREDANSEKRELLKKKGFLPLSEPPFYKLSMTSMVWNISTGQLRLAVWPCSLPAPAHLLISRIWD